MQYILHQTGELKNYTDNPVTKKQFLPKKKTEDPNSFFFLSLLHGSLVLLSPFPLKNFFIHTLK